MSKNLTRKGLAFGALVAMGASVLAGAPAQATSWNPANAISTTYDGSGTGTTSIEGADFVLAPTKDVQFSFYNPQTGEFSTTDLDQTVYDDQLNATCTGYDDDYNITYDNWISTGSVQWTLSNSAMNVDGNTFTIDEISADQTGTATPYLDLQTLNTNYQNCGFNSDVAGGDQTTVNGVVYNAADGDQDSNEPTGAATSLTFLNNTGAILTTVLNGAVASLTTQDLTTKVSGPTGVNIDQLQDDVEVRLYKDNLEIDDNILVDTVPNPDVYSIDEIALSDNVGSYSWPTGSSTGYYTTRAFLGINSSTALSALTAETIVGQLNPDASITGISIVDDATANLTDDRDVRAGTKSFDIAAQLYTADGSDDGDSNDALAKSGVTVKFHASLSNAAVGSVIKINGTTITSGGVDVTTTTDAKGVAKVNITSNTGANADAIYVDATVLAAGGNVTAYCGPNTWEWVTAYAINFSESHEVGYDAGPANSPLIGTQQNASVTLNYVVTDNFGQPMVKTGYEYQVRVVDGYGTSHELDVTAPVTNGKATVSFNNQEVAGTRYDVVASLWTREVGTTNWVVVEDFYEDNWDNGYDTWTSMIMVNHTGSTPGALIPGKFYIYDNNDDFVAVTTGDITTDDFITFNANNTNWNTTLLEEPNENSEAYFNGTVLDGNNVPLAGVAVTISSPGVQFTDDYVYSVGSITVYTDENGVYSVEWFSHKSGANVFTATAGGKSASSTITLNNPTDLHATDVLTVSAPKAVQSGTVTTVSVKLVDKFGNGIDNKFVNLGLVGEGYLSSNRVELENGAASVVLINGVNDTSKATITAATEHASVDAWMNRVNKSFSQSVTTGSVATVKASSVKGRLLVDVDNSRNETVRVYVDGKLVKKVVASAHHQLFKINGLKKGKHKVTVTSDYQNLVTGFKVTIK